MNDFHTGFVDGNSNHNEESCPVRLFIIWGNGRNKESMILDDMRACFTRVKVYEIEWTKQSAESNFSRFFEKKVKLRELQKKYGFDSFLVCIVEDDSSKIEEAWCRYKKMLDEPKSIYATSTYRKTNRDITLLLGKNYFDLRNEDSYQSDEITLIKKDLEGENGFNNLAHFFYVLNNTINYVVLRNYESLPNNFDPSIHGDIDLLVESLHKIVSLTKARKMFPKNPTSVAYYVQFKTGEIQYDFRYQGDGYLDEKWEQEILRTAREITPPPHSDSFMVMTPVNQYFTLLYHAYVQKWQIASDYPQKLHDFALEVGATYKNEIEYSMRQLWSFMKDKNYHISIPSEAEGTINWQNLKYTDEYSSTRIRYKLKNSTIRFKLKVQRVIKRLVKIF